MAKTRSMTRSQNLNASSRKMIKNHHKVVVPHWSDLNHDVLSIVMMQLGVIDFLSFSGVCKSWRSLALVNKNSFLASTPPMLIRISTESNEKEKECYLEDFEGRRFKTILPHSVGRTCYGITCGYLILYGKETRDFWLVNLITRHELHFTNVPLHVFDVPTILTAILVFSPSISEWVLVITNGSDKEIWFSIAGKGAWNNVSSVTYVRDLHAFKGKIYVLLLTFDSQKFITIFEMRLDRQPILKFLNFKYFTYKDSCRGLISSGENLYLKQFLFKDSYKVYQLDFSQVMTTDHKQTTYNECTFFLGPSLDGATVKPESWANPRSQYRGFADIDKSENDRYRANMWYFPNDSDTKQGRWGKMYQRRKIKG